MDKQLSEDIALRALIWILSDDDRAQRLLALTGLNPDDMRASIGEAWLLSAAFSYLEGYEPDLIKCCNNIEIEPSDMTVARKILSHEEF